MSETITSPSSAGRDKTVTLGECLPCPDMKHKRELGDSDLLIVYRTPEGLGDVEMASKAGRFRRQPHPRLKFGGQEIVGIEVDGNLFPVLAIFSKGSHEDAFNVLRHSYPLITDAERLSVRRLLDGRVAFSRVRSEDPELLLNVGLGVAYARQVGIKDMGCLYERDYYPLLTPDDAVEANHAGRLGIDRYGRSVLLNATPLELLAIQEESDELAGIRTDLTGVRWFEEALASMPGDVAAEYRELYGIRPS